MASIALDCGPPTEQARERWKSRQSTGESFSDLASLIGSNGALYFTANGGTELWINHAIDTPAGSQTETIKIASGFNTLGSLTDVNGTLYFTSDTGTRLWKCIGTQTERSANEPDVLCLASLANANGTLYFTSNGGTHIWKALRQGPTKYCRLRNCPISRL